MPGVIPDSYRETVANQPRCEHAWFPETLCRAQAGDVTAIREISGALLRLALEAAESASVRKNSRDVMDLVQEANHALFRAIEQYRGKTLDDLLRDARDAIESRMNELY